MDLRDLMEWYKLRDQVVNGWVLSKQDQKDLVRLNHLVMEASHNIHNDNMLRKDK